MEDKIFAKKIKILWFFSAMLGILLAAYMENTNITVHATDLIQTQKEIIEISYQGIVYRLYPDKTACLLKIETNTTNDLSETVSFKGAEYTVTEIGAYALFGESFHYLKLPATVTKLGDYALYDVTAEQILLPGQLTEIGERALSVDNLDAMTFVLREDGNRMNIEDGILYNADQSELLVALRGFRGDFRIPETVRRIHAYAFAGTDREEIYFFPSARIWVPEGVKVLEQGAFACTWLKSLSLPSTIERIEADAWTTGAQPGGQGERKQLGRNQFGRNQIGRSKNERNQPGRKQAGRG